MDVVHGHSSPHPPGIEVYHGRPVLYGWGDFINDCEGIGGREEHLSVRGSCICPPRAPDREGNPLGTRVEAAPDGHLELRRL